MEWFTGSLFTYLIYLETVDLLLTTIFYAKLTTIYNRDLRVTVL